jgi:ADP-ribose pyrophosphatase YjhB (NUDIX family)
MLSGQLIKDFIHGHLSYQFAVHGDGVEALPTGVRCWSVACPRAAVPQPVVNRPVRALSGPVTLPTRSALGWPPPGRRVTQVGIAAHIARLRAVIGHELLLLPSVSVLPVDGAGRVLLVRHSGHDDGWGVLGGAVDVGESPAAAAIRETREEIGADVHLVRLVDVLGGPDYEVSYPNGDRTAYVTAVYEARIITGSPAPGDGELSELAWFTPGQLPGLQLSRFSRALLRAAGRL